MTGRVRHLRAVESEPEGELDREFWRNGDPVGHYSASRRRAVALGYALALVYVLGFGGAVLEGVRWIFG